MKCGLIIIPSIIISCHRIKWKTDEFWCLLVTQKKRGEKYSQISVANVERLHKGNKGIYQIQERHVRLRNNVSIWSVSFPLEFTTWAWVQATVGTVDHDEFWVDWVLHSFTYVSHCWNSNGWWWPLPIAVLAVACTQAQVVNSNSTSAVQDPLLNFFSLDKCREYC